MSKKKIKKALKMLGAGAAIAGLGKAFMNNRARAAMLKGADANAGFREMFTRPNMMDIAGRAKIKPKMMDSRELDRQLMELNTGTDFGLGPLDGAKDGGRITKSGVKRTKKFGKKKKQANKMRKK
jgi:hypothetical protein|tara:strand:+ start:46 stop:420 length:375 start_codon:yes stop_codon:yes gene_type:complete